MKTFRLTLKGISPEELPEICEQVGFKVLPISPDLCSTYHQLTISYHKDHFDKMLIGML